MPGECRLPRRGADGARHRARAPRAARPRRAVGHRVGGEQSRPGGERALMINTGVLDRLPLAHHRADLADARARRAAPWQPRTGGCSALLTNLGQKRKLPREFLDEMYDNFDRDTRHAVLKHYRAESNPARAAAARRRRCARTTCPALVVWGARDPYLGVDLARAAEAGFSRAHASYVFPDSGHWPFIDNPEEVAAHVLPFLREQHRPPPRRRDGHRREPQIPVCASGPTAGSTSSTFETGRGGGARAGRRPGAGAEPLRVDRPDEPRLDRRGADLPAARRHRRVHAQRRPRPRDLLGRRRLSRGLARDGARRLAGLRRRRRGRASR